MPDSAAPSATPQPTLTELFSGFAAVSVASFGGALPWARRMIVEQRRWMTTEEFNEAFALSQFLPGPNVINFSVVFGGRFGGAAGAAVALAGGAEAGKALDVAATRTALSRGRAGIALGGVAHPATIDG